MYGVTPGVLFDYTPDDELRPGSLIAQRAAPTSKIGEVDHADDLVLSETDHIRFADMTKILEETYRDSGAEISTTHRRG